MSVKQFVSVAEAARLVGRSPNTLYRDYLRTGKLSSIAGENGRKQISISELIRVFGMLSGDGKSVDVSDVGTSPDKKIYLDTSSLSVDMAVLRAENSHLKALVDISNQRLIDKESHIHDLQEAVKLLEYKKPEKQRRVWWKFWV